jgi:Uma2 family endonuclease
MALEVPQGYTVDDLDWARLQNGTPHVELDPWGNLIVTPASNPHEYAIRVLQRILERALAAAEVDGDVYASGPVWRVPGGTGYTNQPDLLVLAGGTASAGPDGLSFSPAPLLVVEVASPSTRANDRGRKRGDYLLGGAGAYWMVDLPRLARVEEPALTAVVRREGAGEDEFGPLTGVVELADPFPVRVDLAALVFTGRWA